MLPILHFEGITRAKIYLAYYHTACYMETYPNFKLSKQLFFSLTLSILKFYNKSSEFTI